MHDNLPVLREVVHKVISRCQLMLHLSGEENSTETDGLSVGVDNSFTGQWRYCVAQTELGRAAQSTHWLTWLLRMRELVLNYTGPGLLLCRGRQLRELRDTIALGETETGSPTSLLALRSL